MKNLARIAIAAIAACCLLHGQPGASHPKFVVADIHPARSANPRFHSIPVHDGRYELRDATMLDLISTAWGQEDYKILGGPNWLEFDRFDITAKLPGETSPDDIRLMLQALLEDRFHLSVRKETRPLPGYALTADKRPALKPAAGSEKSGCVPQASSTSGGLDMTLNGPNPTHYTVGPGSVITYSCRNIPMDAFAQGLQTMAGVRISPGPIVNVTGLKGVWNFDIHWADPGVFLAHGLQAHVSVFDALDQQLGLKLEERPVAAPALVVASVNRTPTANSPDLARVMPVPPLITQFEVASVRPVDPRSHGGFNRRVEPKRLTIENAIMRYLLEVAFPAQIIEKKPDWVESDAYNITATAPAGVAPLKVADLGPPILALLKERFRLAYHTEQRPGPVYVIETVKPKLKKADPTHRTSCVRDTAPSAAQGFLTRYTCHNITMAEFTEWFSHNAIGMKFGTYSDGTGLTGAWDFTFVYDATPTPATSQPDASATDPGGSYTIFEAFQRQLGLRLVTTTKPRPVIVIDHLDQKPTE